ncbi:hypothetical protein BU16DRAFT_614686 [Lophium mytilinum]|uniref:Uncharacterized protein n=1 Tax=Lophium mytilinum TaxID=390894 RepID=A0A6A6R3B9_9PEZI|nr:hypothetical protein BU16DRAFT_614686 [Lophium mytilinum]
MSETQPADPVTFVCIQLTPAASTQDDSGRRSLQHQVGLFKTLQHSGFTPAQSPQAQSRIVAAGSTAGQASKEDHVVQSFRCPKQPSCREPASTPRHFPLRASAHQTGRCFPSSSNTRGPPGTSRGLVHVLDPLFNSLIVRTSACPTRASCHGSSLFVDVPQRYRQSHAA